MSRHKDDYEGKLQTDRLRIDEQGWLRLTSVVIQGRDRGRLIHQSVSLPEIESLCNRALDLTHRRRVDQLVRDLEKKAFDSKVREIGLKQQVADGERRNQQLEHRNKELEGKIERVHDVTRPDRSEAVGLLERPNVVPSTSNVAH